MSILLYAIIIVAVVLLAGNSMLAGMKRERRDKRIGERVDVYIQSLEREGMPEPLSTMSAAERHDTLMMAGRQAHAEKEKRFYVLVIGGLAAAFLAVGFAIEGAGMRDFVIAMIAGAVVVLGAYGILLWLFRRKMTAQGIDVDRLKIE